MEEPRTKRQKIWAVPDLDFKIGEPIQCKNHFLPYLNVVTSGSLETWENLIFTSKFPSLYCLLQECDTTRIKIAGPKGCGKTVLCAAMYQMFHDKDIDSVFLAANSFVNHPVCEKYFRHFAEHHGVSFPKQFTNNDSFQRAVQNVVLKVANAKSIHVFTDFSVFSKADQVPLTWCLISVISMTKIVMSLSSGTENKLFKGNEVRILGNLLQCVSLQTTHFTEIEAEKYLNLIKSDLTLTDIRSVSGTNPYLLAYARKGVSFDQFTRLVDGEVERFIAENFSDVQPEPRSVLSFQVTESVRACWKFAYYAINGAVLTDDELTHYKDTWLAKHNLTLCYKKASSLTTSAHQQPAAAAISSHQQLSSSSQNEEDVSDQQQQATTEQNYALKWNFPTMGQKFIRMLERYVKNSTKESLIAVCQKEPGFAGFWFETKFYDFLRESKTLHVEYVDCSATGTANSATLSFDSVCSLCSPVSQLTRSTVLELRSLHPIIDSVGILQENSREWLVFIQVSLQGYNDHKKKMSALFFRPISIFSRPIELKGQGNITLFTYYKKLCAMRGDPNVMLLYVSPKEDATSSILPELRKEVSSKYIDKLHVAVLSAKSKFYSTLDEFKSYL